MLHYLDVAIWSRSVSIPYPSWLPVPRQWFDPLEVGLLLEVSLVNLFFCFPGKHFSFVVRAFQVSKQGAERFGA